MNSSMPTVSHSMNESIGANTNAIDTGAMPYTAQRIK